MADLTDYEVTLSAVRMAGQMISFGLPTKPDRPKSLREKAFSDLQTNVDVEIEHAIRRIISRNFPLDEVEGEELGRSPGFSGACWYIDPIDGTSNLVAGRPDIAISIARFRASAPLTAAISFPCRQLEISLETPGQGLRLNGLHFHGSGQDAKALRDAIIGLPSSISGGGRASDRLVALLKSLSNRCRGIRISGALGYELGQVAIGELDARLSFAAGAVDAAAGVAIVRESGGVVSDLTGSPWAISSRGIIAAKNRNVHSALVEIVCRIE